MANILLVEDDKNTLNILNTLLKTEGHDVVATSGGDEAIPVLEERTFNLILSDIRMSPVSGMDLLKLVHDKYPMTTMIMLTGFGTVETAIDALELGAFDYVTKPFKVDELFVTVNRALAYDRSINEQDSGGDASDAQTYRFPGIVAESEAMQKVCDTIERIAPTDTAVLIYGESGTGKEIIAKALHTQGPRASKEFVAVNCAALPEPLLESEMFGHVKGAFTGAEEDKTGLFETAQGGTLFLDEIGCMPASIQGKLLRALQEKEVRPVGSNKVISVDVRIVSASNSRLESLVKAGEFRNDLFYRLSVIPIDIPPLRERTEDILSLTQHFLRAETADGGEVPALSPEASSALSRYDWPGNVRELENAVKHALAFVQDNTLELDVLPPKIAASAAQGDELQQSILEGDSSSAGAEDFRGRSLRNFLRAKEEEYLKQVLASTGGDKQKAAEVLDISLATLYRKLQGSDDTNWLG